MTRLSWALLLALGMHVLLLGIIIIPPGWIQQPEIPGATQITVSIARPLSPPPVKMEPQPEPKREPIKTTRPQSKPPDTGMRAAKIKPAPLPRVDHPAKVHRKVTAARHPAPEKAVKKSEAVTPPEATTAVSPAAAASSSGKAARAAIRRAMPLAAANQPPAYPDLARRRGWEGTVVLKVLVGENGLTREVRVANSSSYRLLDKAAEDAVRQWRFMPGTRGGKPVDMEVLVPVRFVLRDK